MKVNLRSKLKNCAVGLFPLAAESVALTLIFLFLDQTQFAALLGESVAAYYERF